MIPRLSTNAPLVLLCSLIVHALHDSLPQERAYEGASQQRLFWYFAGGISGSLYTRDKRAAMSGSESRRVKVLISGHKGHQRGATENLVLKRLRIGGAKKIGTIEKVWRKSHAVHPVRLTYLDLRFVYIFRLRRC